MVASMSQPANRRRSPRAPLKVRVSWGLASIDVALAMGQARDVSLHGMYIEVMLAGQRDSTRHHLEKGKGVSLKLRPPTAEEPVALQSTIVRVDEDPETRDVSGFAVDFNAGQDEATEVIRAYLETVIPDEL